VLVLPTSVHGVDAGIRLWSPLTLFHTASFARRIGWVSGFEKSQLADWLARGAFAPLVAQSETPGIKAVYGRRLGDAEKAADIGVAAASYWVIGPTPRISSIVRSIDTVE
jgi:hypothetical protein